MIKVLKMKKLKEGKKKYEIIFEKDGRKYVRKFGAAGMSDYTKHKDKERRERYISRHKKDLRTKDPMAPGYLSMYILWNKPTIKGSLEDYKKRLKKYNRTGKFPKGISGSKKLKFGTSSIIPVRGTLFEKLPGDIMETLQEPRSAEYIQKIVKGKKVRDYLKSEKFLKDMLFKMNVEHEGVDYGIEEMREGEPWLVLNPGKVETVKWLYNAAEILTEKDFDEDELWYKCLEHVVDEISYYNPDINRIKGKLLSNMIGSSENIEIILKTIGYNVDTDEPYWYNRALYWLQREYATGNV